ncbi:hypothetical protein J7T55_003286 [Diaporthe amygdali]|uniref:uncharacterized protein n=1 Tax=Phomopsis amygdali TaxID=1214568 RepID=UPI0022FDC198|nr:uncharacterized protein J7T55_003286 [Diaporthe amygdali]KAJ0122770.1 hypothetical protein J7T55_003286 [Diaporthe amygdali]
MAGLRSPSQAIPAAGESVWETRPLDMLSRRGDKVQGLHVPAILDGKEVVGARLGDDRRTAGKDGYDHHNEPTEAHRRSGYAPISVRIHDIYGVQIQGSGARTVATIEAEGRIRFHVMSVSEDGEVWNVWVEDDQDLTKA